MKQETFTRPPDGDVDQGWAILAICWAFIACALTSTMLRVWVRSRLTHNLRGDDYVAVAAMVRETPLPLQTRDPLTLCAQATDLVTLNLVDVDDWRRIDHGRSPHGTGQARVLPDRCAAAAVPGHRLGRLDTDIHHSRAHEDLDLPVPSPYRLYQAGGSSHVRSHSVHYPVQRRERLPVPRRLQTPQGILGCGGRRGVSVETSGRVHRPGARQ